MIWQGAALRRMGVSWPATIMIVGVVAVVAVALIARGRLWGIALV